MEKSEVIGCYNRGKHYIETCLEQIASLEQNNDKELRQVLRGTAMVDVSYKAAENFGKVCEYIINGEDGAQKLKGKLLDLKEKVRQLYDSADKHNLTTIKTICNSILEEIGEVEEWTNDNESDGIQELPQPEIILETGNNEGDGIIETPKADQEPMTKDDIVESLEGTETFVPIKPINLYGICYDRLTKGTILNENGDVCKLEVIRKVCDDDKENIGLFKYCVERADISKIVNTGRKSYARLFMNDIASYFQEPEKFRKAAAKSFEVKDIGGVGGKYKINYRLLMKGLFLDDADYRKRES